MIHIDLKRAALASAVALGAAFAAVGTAQAKVYVGAWDPAYGSPLTSLGWRGKAEFFIPDACLSLSGLIANNDGCSSGGMQILSGKVELYNVGQSGQPTLETLFYDAGNIDLTIQMRVTNGELAGVVGGFLLPETSSLSIAKTDPLNLSVFWLGFNDTHARLANCQFNFFNPTCSLDKPSSSSDGFMTFTSAVPEPEAYALALAALSVIGVMGRRRRK